MNYQRSTRYALYAAIELAAAVPGDLVTAASVSEKYSLPPTVLAKVFQRLVSAKLVVGLRGVTGGYRLARPPAEITVLEVVEIFEGQRTESACALASCDGSDCGLYAECRLRQLFDEVDQQARATFASVTLETLVAPRTPLIRLVAKR